MEIGMLWFDNDKRSDYPEKIARAAAYYHKKYGKAPNICFVHPGTIKTVKDDQLVHSQGVEIRISKTMLPNHFWIGVDDR